MNGATLAAVRRTALHALGLLLQVLAVLVAVRTVGAAGNGIGALEVVVMGAITAALALAGQRLRTRNSPLAAA